MWFVDRSGEPCCCWHVFKLTRSTSHRPFPPSRHFDPFGTEFSVKPGQANHSLRFTKSFQVFVAVPSGRAPVATSLFQC